MKFELLLLGSILMLSNALDDVCIFPDKTTAVCDSQTTVETFKNFFTHHNGTLLTSLNLTNCHMPILPTGLFRQVNLTNLAEITIDNCGLTKIEEKTFFGLPQMKKLVIRNNHIPKLIPNQFDNMRILNELYLDNNNIEDIPAYTFNGLNGLVNLSLTDNKINVLKKDFLQTSGYIERVSLRNSGVSKIEPFAFGFISNLREIDLRGNVIPHLKANSFMGLSEMETLNLSSISIRTIDPKTFTSMAKLKHLDLTNNHIQNISVDTFYGLSSLESLNMLGNEHINHIMNNSFFGLHDLQTLKLPKYCYKNISTGFFSGLTNLKELDLSNMELSEINPELFQGLLKLETLNISGNQIKSLKYNSFYKLPHLKRLDLSKNSLKNFGIELAVCTYNNDLKKVELNENPWDCHRLLMMLNHLDQLNITYDKTFYELPYVKCQGSTFNRGIRQVNTRVTNIKRVCEKIPIEIETESPIVTKIVPTMETTEGVRQTTEVNVRTVLEEHLQGNKLEIDYLALFIILVTAIGFSLLMVQLVLRSIKAGRKGYQTYHFSTPTSESQAQLNFEGIENPLARNGARFNGLHTKFEVA